MSTVLKANESESISLPRYNTLTIVASAGGSGRITRLPDASGGASGGFADLDPGETSVIGPFAQTTQHKIDAYESTLTLTVSQSGFLATTPDVEHIVRISQTDYDALSSPNPSTLYLIVG